MQTIAHDFVSSRATGTGPRPFKTIALLAGMALAMSACETTRPQKKTVDDRPPTIQTRQESKETAPESFGKGPPTTTQQGSSQESTTSIGTDPTQRRQLVTAMFNQAAILGKEGDLSRAIPVYREIEQLYGDGPGDDKALGAWAVFYQGNLQRQLRNHKAAVAAFERLDQRFGQTPDLAVREIVADALHKKGETLIEQGSVRAAIATFDEADRRYAGDRDAGFRLRAVRALFAKGTLLGKQGAGEEPGESPGMGIRPTGDTAAAVAVYDDIARRFGRDKDANVRNLVGGALLEKSEALRLVGDDQGTLATYGEIIDRFGKDDALFPRRLVATALLRKGLALGRQEGGSPAAINTFEEIIRRYATDPDANVRKIVGQANTAKQRLLSGAVPMPDANQPNQTKPHPQNDASVHDN